MVNKNSKIKIVVVEDDQFLSRVLVFRLKGEGFDVVLATDGDTAIKTIKDEKPDIILLDILLPKKNGFEVLQDIKSDAISEKIPVVILSNLGQQSDIDKGMQLGAVDYLVKAKFDMKDIVAKIREHLIS